ncbi:type II secretion system protein G [Janthinobacterium sp. BJB412]|nr:type II secretion system protein G [Janthinobacterium sp. BJB412]
MRIVRGFTMIELLVTLAIIAMLLTLAAPRYFGSIERTKEDVLREDLYILRNAIDHYYADKNVYPAELKDLVKEKYLRSLPVDPYTQSANSWTVVPATDVALGVVSDVKSGSGESARDGSKLKDW